MIVVNGINIFPVQISEVLKKTTGIEPRFQIIVENEDGEDVMEVMVEVQENMFDDEIKKLLHLRSGITTDIEREVGVVAKITFVEQETIQMTADGRPKLINDKR